MKSHIRLKRLIAREGLILLSLIIVGALWEVASVAWLNTTRQPESHIRYLYDLPQIMEKSLLCLALGYPAYLIPRFVIWSIATLRATSALSRKTNEE